VIWRAATGFACPSFPLSPFSSCPRRPETRYTIPAGTCVRWALYGCHRPETIAQVPVNWRLTTQPCPTPLVPAAQGTGRKDTKEGIGKRGSSFRSLARTRSRARAEEDAENTTLVASSVERHMTFLLIGKYILKTPGISTCLDEKRALRRSDTFRFLRR